jgi:WG containing repeat
MKLSLLLFFCILLVPIFLVTGQQNQNAVALKSVYINGYWGYADKSGKVVIPARFDAALPFARGLARVGIVDEELPEIDGRPNLLWGYINESGRVVVELRYNALREFVEGLAAAAVLEQAESVFIRRTLDNLKWGYVNEAGRVVIPIQFLDAGNFSEGLAQVNVPGPRDSHCGPPGNYGYIDKTGSIVIKPQFAMALSFKDGRARVSIGRVEYMGRCLCCAPRFIGKFGYVSRNGELVLEPATSEVDSPDLESVNSNR